MEDISIKLEPFDEETYSVVQGDLSNHPREHLRVKKEPWIQSTAVTGRLNITTTATKEEPVDLLDGADYPTKVTDIKLGLLERGDLSGHPREHLCVKKEPRIKSTAITGGLDITTAVTKEEPVDLLDETGYSTKVADIKLGPLEQGDTDNSPDTSKEMRGDEAVNVLPMVRDRPYPVTLYQVDPKIRNNTGTNIERLENDNLELHTDHVETKSANIVTTEEPSRKSTLLQSRRMKKSKPGEKSHKCLHCSYSCVSRSDLQRHGRIHTGEKPYKCSMCSYSSARRGDLESHKLIHTDEKPYKCSMCSYSSVRRGNLENHKLIHTGDKPYTCSVCSFRCTMVGNLKRHERTHTGEKPYKCLLCPFNCAQSGQLKEHKRVHTGEKPYNCSLCPFNCAQSGQLNEHKRVHTGEKPYKCSLCSFNCVRRGNLVSHKLIHTGEKPYKCSMCSFSSVRRDYLVSHKLVHAGEKPYKCSMCSYSSAWKGNLESHKLIHTSEKP